ncbi:MAG: hypothetical protein FE048_00245 [Thermoplasmata archaeon]|nr:MAG: hypothetical protein FE048_00245 [Thermoplasmata archaeon]
MKSVAFLITLLLLPQLISIGYADEIPQAENADHYEKGYRYNIQGWIYVHIEGNAYERGYQHGYLLYAEIIDMIYRWTNVIHNCPVILKYIPLNQSSERYEKISQTWWNYCKRKAMDLFEDKFPDEYKQEMKGIADAVAFRGGEIYGEKVTYDDILTLNEMYELMTVILNPQKRIHPLRTLFYDLLGVAPELKGKEKEFISSFVASPPTHHCNGFIATGDATTEGQIVAADSVWCGGWWYTYYIAQRWNVILDIKPTNGNRIIMATSPGYIWSDENYYQNDEGIILIDTTAIQGLWKKKGLTLAIRSRKASQYSSSIDDALYHLKHENNGVWTGVWLIGDTKTGEIARLDLGLYTSAVWRTKNGFYWSANNPIDASVRREQLRFESIKGRLFQIAHILFNTSGYEYYTRNYIPSERDIKFEELGNEYYGRIDVDVVKEIMSTLPISDLSTDCKITDTFLLSNHALWAFWGNPYGYTWNTSVLQTNLRGVKDVPPAGWVLIHAIPDDVSPSFTYNPVQEYGGNAEIIWEVDIGCKNHEWGSGIVRNDTLYITTNMGNMYAIDVSRGTIRWSTSLEKDSLPPSVHKEVVFVGSERLHAFNKDGTEKWEKEISISSPPVIYEDSIIVGCKDGTLYSFALNGKEIWKMEFNEPIFPAIWEKKIYATAGSSCYCIDGESKETLWSFKADGVVLSPPLVKKGMVYFGSMDACMYALDAEKGELKWRYKVGWGIKSTPAFDDEYIFFGSLDNTFYAVDAKNGELKWSFTCKSAIQGSPAIYGEYVFFGCDDGRIYAVNKSNGKVAWSFSPSHALNNDVYNYITTPIPSSPTISNGIVFIGAGGKIFALDAQTEEKEIVKEKKSIPSSTIALVVIPLLIILALTFLYYRKG